MRGIKQTALKTTICSFGAVSFCAPLSFPKTRRRIPKLGLNYEIKISSALARCLYRANAGEAVGSISLPVGSISLNPLDSILQDRLYFWFCHNPWINFSIQGEDFKRNCSPDFIIFISLVPLDSISLLSDGAVQIPNDMIHRIFSDNVMKPSWKCLRQYLSGAIVIEAKYTYVPEAHKKLKFLYQPLVEMASGVKSISSLVICKNLIPDSPIITNRLLNNFRGPSTIQFLGGNHDKLSL